MSEKITNDENEQQILDTALQESDQLLARSLHDDERRRKRKRLLWLSVLVLGVVLASVIAFRPNSDRVNSDFAASVQSQPKKSKATSELPKNSRVKIDLSDCDSPEWKAAIDRQQDVPRIKSGHGQMTLLRVVLPGASPDALLQITSTKVVELGQGGGGAFRQIQNGDFIVVEHINSARRRNGKDPIEIGGFACHRAKLYVDVPPPGKLGILGDVILTPCAPQEMGFVIVTVEEETVGSLEHQKFIIGPIAVGGPYGKAFPFSRDYLCATGPIAPGEYKTFLPGFNRAKNRKTIQVLPGKVTHVRFAENAQEKVVKIEVAVASSLAEATVRKPTDNSGDANSPDATFNTAKQAMVRGDYMAFCQCFTEDGLSLMAGSLRMMTGMLQWAGQQQGADPQSVKLSQGLDRINQRYIKSQLESEVHLDLNASAEDFMAVVRKMAEPISDHSGYVTAVFKLLHTNNSFPNKSQPMADATLQDITVEGESANATMIGTFLKPRKSEEPIMFRRVGRTWKIEQLGSFGVKITVNNSAPAQQTTQPENNPNKSDRE